MEIFVSHSIFAFTFGPVEVMIVLALGVMLFGKSLPEIGRNLGQSLVEFKKGINELKESGEKSLVASAKKKEEDQQQLEEQEADNVPKFEPPV